ncbi:2-oxoglutarate dehydrogenase complex dihydrolipoyllysine-residue succinyltransferase [Rhodovulum tesquicola]|uniref:2-oxoglutarate dehydrogenase complex dihydrolipoyllysine-residue succinyltransferase n=1 Tax=Rhodovulum tesquicola TaxID=540254 RepID=UPI002096D602|nr:2-oxoglutarate dehydrogenase complex dihydrolipoyllysine-residue succinyltransferase [Rhodovulum tesquicola]MCO8145744.1 2-oxoglutarate dehydrogenase complex dihydrolipoyllysine-residue succinyltransferase [Rhodovulum tesquicola]
MSTEVRVPTLGESVTEATVATWFKKPGDPVAADEMLCELETDKVTVEVPAPAAGTLGEIVAPEGETVSVDALLATITEGAAKPAAGKARAARPDAAPQAAQDIAVMVPTLGESVAEATVSTWFKAQGDHVERDEILCELETDKVSVEVPAPAAGTLGAILAAEGTTVAAGGQLATLVAGEGAAASPAPKPAAAPAPTTGKDIEHAPSAKKLMAEKGLSPDAVTGSGRDGRIMKEDVMRAAEAPKPAPRPAEPPRPAPDAARAPIPAEDAAREERVRMTRLRQTIARRLKDAQNSAAMLTTYNEIDMSGVMALRKEYKDLFEKKHGVKLGFMSFFTKACCHALAEVPEVNAEIDGTDIVYKQFVHMGIAVGTPSGLVVPVLRNAHAMGFAEIEKRIAELGIRARDGKLSMAEMQGGTFTISNGGVYGSLMSSPILNPPQSGILGMHKIQDRPVVVAGQIVIRPMMYLALSYDHRIVDGKGAVTFLVRVKEALEDPRRLLMDL